MLRALGRPALAAVLLGAVAAVPAKADGFLVVVPGCYGAEDLVFCEPSVFVEAPQVVEAYPETVTVCAVTCVDVPAVLVRPANRPGRVCVGWWDGDYVWATSACVPIDVDIPTEIFES